MEKVLNYPIKYAILELKTKGGFIHNFEDITVGFIVSKCYVVNQNIRYYEDGSSKTTYHVVFPYNDIHNFKWRTLGGFTFYDTEISPSFGYHGNCMNANVVSSIYDNFDEADKYLEDLKHFNEDIDICKRYEQAICELTSSMDVTTDNIQGKQFSKNI